MIAIQNISKSFGDIHALKGVSLELKPGLFGLLGPNGAGKSTLMRTMATLQTPDSGTITFEGVDITQKPDAMRSVLGYLPQDFGVYPRMNADALLDHIAILKGVHNKADRKAQIDNLLNAVNLTSMRKASVATYSGGMKQRFGVAQALLGNPKVLIVDEPTAGLDPFERQRFLDLLSETAEDKVVILSTHIVEDVYDVCSDMGIMGGGELITRGTPDEMIGRVEGKLYRKTTNKAEAREIKKNMQMTSARLRKQEVIVSIISQGDPGNGFEPVKPLLEDAYFAHLYKFV
jgi:ABC-type multidrug transport system ATPase subunit